MGYDPALASTQSSTARVLCVDDDPILRALIKSKVGPHVATFVEAEDGVSAWHELRSAEYDLAFVDLDMPGLNGVDLIRCVRGATATSHIPIVVITSHSDPEAMRLTLEVGATAYLTKPVTWSLFEPFVVHILQLASARNSQMAVANDTAVMLERLFFKLLSIQKLAIETMDQQDSEVVEQNIVQLHRHANRAIALLSCTMAMSEPVSEPEQ
ncbi:MAG: response regulator [Hyphomicrobiaceae bacterium]